jgi:hypothetical protein
MVFLPKVQTMGSVYLACEASSKDHPFARRDYERFVQYSVEDEIKKHSVCSNPSQADLVIFIGSARARFSDITSSWMYKKYKKKSVIFYSGDKSIPILPGVYVCLESRRSIRYRKSILSGYYLRVTDNYSMDLNKDINSAKYLFSFSGNANNHPARKRVCALPGHRSYLRDSSEDANQQDDGVDGDNIDRGVLYRDLMAESKFVLCPRGIGVSSWRLFETIRAGRVPVIISDSWIRPKGPSWDSFSITVKENEIESIPAILEENEHRAEELGAMARKEWQAWYSKAHVFTTVVDQLFDAQAGYTAETSFSRVLTYTQYLDPFYFRHWVLSPTKSNIKNRVAGLLRP